MLGTNILKDCLSGVVSAWGSPVISAAKCNSFAGHIPDRGKRLKTLFLGGGWPDALSSSKNAVRTVKEGPSQIDIDALGLLHDMHGED